jgi:hypothetical protein
MNKRTGMYFLQKASQRLPPCFSSAGAPFVSSSLRLYVVFFLALLPLGLLTTQRHNATTSQRLPSPLPLKLNVQLLHCSHVVNSLHGCINRCIFHQIDVFFALFGNSDHCFYEAVKSLKAFGFGRFDHQRF